MFQADIERPFCIGRYTSPACREPLGQVPLYALLGTFWHSPVWLLRCTPFYSPVECSQLSRNIALHPSRSSPACLLSAALARCPLHRLFGYSLLHIYAVRFLVVVVDCEKCVLTRIHQNSDSATGRFVGHQVGSNIVPVWHIGGVLPHARFRSFPFRALHTSHTHAVCVHHPLEAFSGVPVSCGTT